MCVTEETQKLNDSITKNTLHKTECSRFVFLVILQCQATVFEMTGMLMDIAFPRYYKHSYTKSISCF